MTPPLSKAASLLTLLRAARELSEFSYTNEKSTRDVLVDGPATGMLADLLELPKDFAFEVFHGMPVKQAEALADWALGMRPFKRVEALDGKARKQGRGVSPEARRAAYEAVVATPLREAS